MVSAACGSLIESPLPAPTEARPALVPGPPYLVKNVGPTTLVDAGGTLLFFSSTGGSEQIWLWRSDGTEAGTAAVKEINHGFGASVVGSATAGTRAVFAAKLYEGAGPIERRPWQNTLWGSDGTEAGTQLVVDQGSCVPTRYCSQQPVFVRSAGDQAFFSSVSLPVYRSDGTPAGTRVVTDLAGGGSVTGPVAVGSGLYFGTRNEDSRGQLWRSDGTAAGTRLVRDYAYRFNFESAPFGPGIAFFTQQYQLWTSDGTDAGTRLVRQFADAPFVRVVGNLTSTSRFLYFFVEGIGGRCDLYRSDGTDDGTIRLKSDMLLANRTTPSEGPIGVEMNGVLYFAADDGVTGRELWRSDGTAEGTRMLADIHPTASSSPRFLTVAGGRLFFSADDGTHGRELWQSDGTAGATTLVGDVLPGAAGSNPYGFVVSGSRLFFGADGPEGTGLWALRISAPSGR
jgi:ELWxxDGT repeat protein